MTAAVEAVSLECEAMMKELDQAFLNAKATASPSQISCQTSMSETRHEQKSRPLKGPKRTQSVASSTRKLRSHTKGLLSPADSQESDKKRLKPTRSTSTKKNEPKSAEPVNSALPNSRKSFKKVSPYFERSPTIKKQTISCIPFPPLSSTSFGLVQERLSHHPFRLLIAVIFLNKTRGSVALPVFYELMERYPSPAELAVANHADVVEIIQHLGLQNQRAKKCINLAKVWSERPPEKAQRYRLLHYPNRGDGKDIKPDEILDESDERVAWEVGQLPGIGAYAIDSWRIFCRDELRGLPHGLPEILTEDNRDVEMQKEWTRVLPMDKELRAYLRWRWLRNGWVWDPLTGEKKGATEVAMEQAGNGGVIYEGENMDVVVAKEESEEMENDLGEVDCKV